jgi:hypothetical protein
LGAGTFLAQGQSVTKHYVMRNFTISALIFSSVIAFSAESKPIPVSVISISSDIFYFKVDKSFIGASVMVYSPTGQVILNEKVNHHKAIIDFYEEQAGKYTIVVKKDAEAVDFVYEKYDSPVNSPDHVDAIALVQ